MANVIADAMMAATQKAGAVAAFINAGGVRSSIDEGSITYGEAITVQPFGNTLVVLDLTGDELRRALEHGVAGFPDKMGAFLHPSRGTSYRFDPAKPAGSRVSEVVIGGQPLDPAKTYPIALLGFTASGGDAHEVLKAAPGRRVDTGLIDVDALVDYIKANSPLNPKPERRIRTP
jgi:5'-nucleotidase